MEGAMLYRKFPAYNLNVSSAIPSDNLVRSMRSFTIPITTNFGLFSQMLKVTLETFLMRRVMCKAVGGRPLAMAGPMAPPKIPTYRPYQSYHPHIRRSVPRAKHSRAHSAVA